MTTKQQVKIGEAMEIMARLALSEDRLKAQVIDQAHTIDDLCIELARFKRANRQALDMLTDALHANDAGRVEVVKEYLERTIEDLYRAANPSKRGE